MSAEDLGDSLRKLGIPSMAEACWERLTRVPLIQCAWLGEPHGPCVVWVKKYTLAKFKSIRIVALSVMSKLTIP